MAQANVMMDTAKNKTEWTFIADQWTLVVHTVD